MSSAKRLAREILDTRRLALGHATSPQLTSSALDGGQLDINDSDGNRIGGLGLGDDGGFVIDYTGGPKPPKPSPPTVTADAGIFRIEWDGSFVNEGDEGVLATSDTDRVEIHASMDENFVPDRVESFGGAFATLDGGSFTLGPLPEAGTYYFRLVARSKSAQFSEPSDRVEQVLAITSIDLEITDAWLTGEAAQNTADGKNSIWRGPDEPEVDPDRPFKDGDVWFEMVDGKSIPNIWDETAGAWVANDDYRQSEIERVQQELRDELDTIVVDGSGTKNFYTPDMPTEGMREGDLWFDSSDKNKPYIYQDGEWITVRDQFVKPSTSLNVTDWGMLQPNMKAIQGQWSNSGYQVELETSDDLGGQSLGVVNIPAGDTGGGFITMPFQGVLSGSSSPEYSDDLFVNEGRPIGLDLQLLYNGPFQPSASQRALTAHYFADGELVDSRTIDYATLSREVFPAAPDSNNPVAFYANLLGYQFGMRVTGTVLPSTVASADEIALTVEIPIPAGAGAEKKLAVWSIDSRVQVPSTGLADGAVTETKVSDDAISTPKLQAGAIVAGKIAANAIETDHLDSKIVTTDKIAAGAITAESGIIGSINAGTITVGEMDGARIKARTIAADRILVGQGGELIPDPYFDNEGAAWGSSSGSAEFSYSAEAAYSNRKYGVKAVPTAGGSTFYFPFLTGGESNPRIDTQADKKYVVEAWVRRTDGDVSNLTNVDMRMYSYSQTSGGALSNGVASGARIAASEVPPNTWVKLTGTWTSPSPAYTYVSPRLTVYTSGGHPAGAATWHLGMVSMKEQAGATLIEGGAISTEHIRAGAITAESGIIGSIDANVITVGKIMGNQLDADAINGKTITGATIRTASSGSRVELTHNGLKQYNSLGATIVDMTAGSFTLQGGSITGSTIKTANSGSRVEINTQGLKQYNSSNEVIAEMVAGSMVMRGVLEQENSIGRLQVGPTFGSGNVSPGISWSNIPGDAYGAGIGVATGTNTVALVMQGPGGSSSASRINLFKERAYIASYASGNSYLNMADKSFTLRAQDSAGDAVGFISANDDKMMVSAYTRNLELWGRRVQSMSVWNTNTSDRPVYINGSTGSLGQGPSSSLRYKQDVEAGRVLDSILDVDLASWRYTGEVDAYAKAARYRAEIGEGPLPVEISEVPSEPGRHYGAIAEQVDELGLSELVFYDAFGRPDALRYELFGVALIPIVRSLRDRIESLEAQLASA